MKKKVGVRGKSKTLASNSIASQRRTNPRLKGKPLRIPTKTERSKMRLRLKAMLKKYD